MYTGEEPRKEALFRMEFLPDIPPIRRDPDGFAEDLRRNARLALSRDDALYLCVLRAPNAAAARALEAHFQFHLYHGEIYCEMEPCVFYMQVFAATERLVQVLLEDAADCVPGVKSQYKIVPKD
jgi:hypothetical protein